MVNFAIRESLLLENPAVVIARRKIAKSKIVIPSKDQFDLLVNTLRAGDRRAWSVESLTPCLAARVRVLPSPRMNSCSIWSQRAGGWKIGFGRREGSRMRGIGFAGNVGWMRRVRKGRFSGRLPFAARFPVQFATDGNSRRYGLIRGCYESPHKCLYLREKIASECSRLPQRQRTILIG